MSYSAVDSFGVNTQEDSHPLLGGPDSDDEIGTVMWADGKKSKPPVHTSSKRAIPKAAVISGVTLGLVALAALACCCCVIMLVLVLLYSPLLTPVINASMEKTQMNFTYMHVLPKKPTDAASLKMLYDPIPDSDSLNKVYAHVKGTVSNPAGIWVTFWGATVNVVTPEGWHVGTASYPGYNIHASGLTEFDNIITFDVKDQDALNRVTAQLMSQPTMSYYADGTMTLWALGVVPLSGHVRKLLSYSGEDGQLSVGMVGQDLYPCTDGSTAICCAVTFQVHSPSLLSSESENVPLILEHNGDVTGYMLADTLLLDQGDYHNTINVSLTMPEDLTAVGELMTNFFNGVSQNLTVRANLAEAHDPNPLIRALAVVPIGSTLEGQEPLTLEVGLMELISMDQHSMYVDLHSIIHNPTFVTGIMSDLRIVQMLEDGRPLGILETTTPPIVSGTQDVIAPNTFYAWPADENAGILAMAELMSKSLAGENVTVHFHGDPAGNSLSQMMSGWMQTTVVPSLGPYSGTLAGVEVTGCSYASTDMIFTFDVFNSMNFKGTIHNQEIHAFDPAQQKYIGHNVLPAVTYGPGRNMVPAATTFFPDGDGTAAAVFMSRLLSGQDQIMQAQISNRSGEGTLIEKVFSHIPLNMHIPGQGGLSLEPGHITLNGGNEKAVFLNISSLVHNPTFVSGYFENVTMDMYYVPEGMDHGLQPGNWSLCGSVVYSHAIPRGTSRVNIAQAMYIQDEQQLKNVGATLQRSMEGKPNRFAMVGSPLGNALSTGMSLFPQFVWINSTGQFSLKITGVHIDRCDYDSTGLTMSYELFNTLDQSGEVPQIGRASCRERV